MSMADGQVRADDVELALVRGERGERLVDAVRQGAERSGFARAEPEHVPTEPVRVVELEAEPAHAREQALKLSEYRRIDRLGRHEREQHRDVGRDAERRAGVEAVPMRGHGWLSLGDLDDQRALRSHAGHGPDVSPARAGPPGGFRLAARCRPANQWPANQWPANQWPANQRSANQRSANQRSANQRNVPDGS